MLQLHIHATYVVRTFSNLAILVHIKGCNLLLSNEDDFILIYIKVSIFIWHVLLLHLLSNFNLFLIRRFDSKKGGHRKVAGLVSIHEKNNIMLSIIIIRTSYLAYFF